jgi:hypothetical protein
MKARNAILWPTLASLVALGTACPKKNTDLADELDAAEQGSDSAQVTSDEAAVLSLTVDGAENARLAQTITGADVAAFAAANAGSALLPATCLHATVADATVTYSFSDCTGPRGLVHLNGVMEVTYTVETAGIDIHATAANFAVNNSTISFDNHAVYTVANGEKALTVEVNGSATGPLGNHFTRVGSYTVSWTPTCVTLDGMWTVTTALVQRTTTVDNLTVCRGSCPAAGGTINHTYRSGLSVTISFDGSAVARWMVGSQSGTIDLVCRPGS